MVIDKLEITGKKLPTASVEFSSIGNVISGASDTGKTFMFECLRYMFGVEAAPKEVPEADGYERVILHLDADGEKFQLERALRGGDYILHRRGESIKKKRKEINDEFLSLMGSGKKKLKKNAANQTIALSFSYLRHYFFVDEVTIMEQESPVLSGDVTHVTRDKSIFRLLLTGKDDSDLIAGETKTVASAKKKGKSQTVQAIVEKFNSKLGANKDLDVQEELDRCDKRIGFISSQMKEINSKSGDYLNEKQETFTIVDELDSQGRELTETIKRFKLLDETYQKDAERLGFIDEGKHLLSQLPSGSCPYCGKEMDHVHESEGTENIFSEDVSKALEAERQKVLKLRSDLELNIKELESERLKLVDKKKTSEDRIRQLDKLLRTEVSNTLGDFHLELKGLMDERDGFLELRIIRKHIEEVESISEAEGSKDGETEKETKDERFGEDKALYALEDEIEKILESWLGKKVKVSFDKEACDIIIGGRARRSFGKGFRSIYRTSFHIGLMNLCIKKNLPHPKFLVVDSPLTTHEESDDKVDEGIQSSFFAYLANYTGGQIIVFDNKEPGKDAARRLKYIRYSGNVKSKNQGFIPAKK